MVWKTPYDILYYQIHFLWIVSVFKLSLEHFHLQIYYLYSVFHIFTIPVHQNLSDPQMLILEGLIVKTLEDIIISVSVFPRLKDMTHFLDVSSSTYDVFENINKYLKQFLRVTHLR